MATQASSQGTKVWRPLQTAAGCRLVPEPAFGPVDRLGWRVWLHRDHPARTSEQRRHRAVRLAEGPRVRSGGESGSIMQARPPPAAHPPPAPGTSPRSFTPRGYESATPSPRSYKAGTAARLPGSSRARTRRPGLHVAPAGRTPVRNGVGVGARVTGSAGRQQRRARLQGEQLPSQGELRQGSFLWDLVRHRQKRPRGSLFARQHHR